jgi:hypothetical protein
MNIINHVPLLGTGVASSQQSSDHRFQAWYFHVVSDRQATFRCETVAVAQAAVAGSAKIYHAGILGRMVVSKLLF